MYYVLIIAIILAFTIPPVGVPLLVVTLLWPQDPLEGINTHDKSN